MKNSGTFIRTLAPADGNTIVTLVDFNQILMPYQQFVADNIVEHSIVLEDLQAKVGLFSLLEAPWPDDVNALSSEAAQQASYDKIKKEGQKVFLEIFHAYGNGPWISKGEEILQNKNSLEQPWALMSPFFSTNETAIIDEDLKIGVRVVNKSQGSGGLKSNDYIKIFGAWRKQTNIRKKKEEDLEVLWAELESLKLAIYGRLTGLPANTLLGRNTGTGVVELIPQSQFLSAASLHLKADLINGLVPTTQLPAFVDDVLEAATLAGFPVTGESGKLYIALNTNLVYRWTGSTYVAISDSLALGITSSSAYRGDLGNTAYTHSQATGNPHGTTKGNIGLSNVDNTSDLNKPVSLLQQIALDAKNQDIATAIANHETAPDHTQFLTKLEANSIYYRGGTHLPFFARAAMSAAIAPTAVNSIGLSWNSVQVGQGIAEFCNYAGGGSGDAFNFFRLPSNPSAGPTLANRIARIDINGAYIQVSDGRLKSNFLPAPGLQELMKLSPQRYVHWECLGCDEDDKSIMRIGKRYTRKIGFIAQELRKILPEAVPATMADEELYGIDYTVIVACLVQAVKDLNDEIIKLKNKKI